MALRGRAGAVAAAAALALAGAADADAGGWSPMRLDAPAYSWTDKVRITVVAPAWNADAHGIDSIGGDREHPVTVRTRGHELGPYRLTETAPDSGVFTGEVTLTGFPHDADGDGRRDTAPRTAGSGPTDGLLEAGRRDAVTVSFEYGKGRIAAESAPIAWSLATVSASVSGDGGSLRVAVADPDMDLDPEAVDGITVGVASDSDGAGAELSLAETGADTGVFVGTVRLAGEGSRPGGAALYAAAGDRVTATYTDRTLPEPHGLRAALDVEAHARAPPGPGPLVEIAGISVGPGPGLPGAGGGPGDRLQIAAGLANMRPAAQDYVVLFQISAAGPGGAGGAALALSWAGGTLGPLQSMGVSQSWTPPGPGEYVAEAFVWESLAEPVPLGPPRAAPFSVGG